MSKSPGKMVHDFCIQAKVEDATISLAGHGCPKDDCGQKRWFHEKLIYFSSFFRRMTQLTQRTQRPLRNASSLNPASTIAFVIALAAKTRMGGCEGRSASATKPGEGHSPLGWGHERTRIRPGFGWRVFLIFVSSWHWNILKSCFLGIRLRLGSYLVDPEATVPSFYPEVCLN